MPGNCGKKIYKNHIPYMSHSFLTNRWMMIMGWVKSKTRTDFGEALADEYLKSFFRTQTIHYHR